MAVTITLNDPVVVDESAGIQTGDKIDDIYTDTDVSYGSLSADFRTYLETTLALNNAFPSNGRVATKSNTVTISSTGTLTDIVFTDSTGGTLNGDPSGLKTTSGFDIYLYGGADAGNVDGDDVVIGRYDIGNDGADDTDPIAFVIFKEDNLNADQNLANVTFHIITYTAIDHPLTDDPDDAVDLSGFLKIAANDLVELDFADLPSGQNLFGVIAVDKNDPTEGGLLLFPEGAVLNADGTFTNTSETTNTSKGGGAVTIGNTNQMFDPGEGHFFIYVDDPAAASVAGIGLDQNNADDAGTIAFTGLNPQTTAQVEIVQVQGNGTAAFTITAYDFMAADTNVNTEAEAKNVVVDPVSALGGTEVNITRVQVFDGGVLVLDSDNALSGNGVTINLTGNTAAITGLNSDYTVEWTTASPHEGVLIHADGGKYDLGGFNLLNTQGESEDVGQLIVIEDDGPAAVINDTGIDVVHDETADPQDGTEAADVADPTSDPGTDDDQAGNPAAATGIPAFETANTLTRLGWALSPSAVVNSTGSAFGTDGTGTESWSLDVPGANTDSGFVDLNGDKILLNKETVDIGGGVMVDVIVGRIDDDAVFGVDGTDPVAIVIGLDANQKLAVAQYVAIGHFEDTGPDQVDTMFDSALLAKLTITDAEGDSITATPVAIGDKVKIEDDAGTAGDPAPADVEEEHNAAGGQLAGGNEDGVSAAPDIDDDVDPGDFNQTKNTVMVDYGAIVSVQPGVDAPASFKINGSAASITFLEGLGLESKGEALSYHVNAAGTLLTAFVDGDADDLPDGATDRTVFTWSVTALGSANFTVLDQLDHAAPLSGAVENVLEIDLTDILDVEDKDGDDISLGDDFALYRVIDDVPIFTAQIANGQVDFTLITGANPDDEGGTSVSSVTNSLNGKVGTDENDATNKSSDGTLHYTFASATIASTSITGLKADISSDGSTAWFFVDGAGGTADQFDAFDTLWFKNVIDQTANGGAGSYTFTVEKAPVPELVALDFADLPSGQNLFGVIAVDKNDPTEGGLLLFPEGAVLNADGTFTNTSETTNTSKGGGAVTIGNTNQMFDPGEGHFFIYVDDPAAASVAGIGLDQNNADDAGTIAFTGLNPQTTAQVEIVQVQGNGTAAFTITAYDFMAADTNVNTEAEAKNVVVDPVSALGGIEVNITRVQVFDGDVLVLDSDNALSGNGVTINLTGNTAALTGLNDDYTVEWTTASPHEGVLIHADGGKYDLGGFNLLLEQPTADQQFDFSILQTDYDGDVIGDLNSDGIVDADDDAFAFFSIGVDGTLGNDDDAVLLV